MDSAGSIKPTSAYMNLSFNGFSNGEIFCGSKWQIVPRTYSTTIFLDRDYIHEVLYHIRAMYGPPQDKGKKGLIFRASNPTATITVYTSTAVINVQGTNHTDWIESILPEIDQAIDDEFIPTTTNDEPLNSTVNDEPLNSHANDDDDDIVFSLAFPITSTPVQTPEPILHCEATTQTSVELCDATTQTDDVQTVHIETQTCSSDVVPDVPSDPCSELSNDSDAKDEIVDIVENSGSSFPISLHHVPSIPTNNQFSILRVEELPHSDLPDEDLPPLPLPPVPAPKPKRRTRPTPKPHMPIPKPAGTCTVPDPSPQTVLILGDSIPKYLDGKRMSRRLTIRNECIRGSKLEDWIKVAPALILEHKPTAVIIHCGTNNVQNSLISKCIELTSVLVQVIYNSDPNITIAFSSLTVQGHIGHSFWVDRYNKRLFEICRQFNCDFIDNNNIKVTHLARDYLHLGSTGIRLLARNYISFLQYFVGRIKGT